MAVAIGAPIAMGAPIIAGVALTVPAQGDPRRKKLRHLVQPVELAITTVTRVSRIDIFLMIVTPAGGTLGWVIGEGRLS